MQATKLPKNIVRYVEHNLYYYHEYLRDIERLRKDILYGRDNNDENIGGGRGNLPSSPTEQKKKLVRLKYWTRPQRYTWDGIAEQLHVSRITCLRRRDEIVYAIAELLGETDA